MNIPEHIRQAVEAARLNASHAASAPAGRCLTDLDTGTYRVELVDLGTTGEEYALRVTFTGPWGSGLPVDVHVRDLDRYVDFHAEDDSVEAADAAALKWFHYNVRGDLNVQGYLVEGGYDRFTNLR